MLEFCNILNRNLGGNPTAPFFPLGLLFAGKRFMISGGVMLTRTQVYTQRVFRESGLWEPEGQAYSFLLVGHNRTLRWKLPMAC